jgi:RNA polymerase sigma-70 factor (ECF subfamily)
MSAEGSAHTMTITDGRAETEAAMRPLPRGVDGAELAAQSGWVRAVARNLVRDPSRAEDVAQETLLAALANPPRDASDARRLRAWLARVAFNLSRLGSRQLARRQARELRVARHETVPSVSDELEAAGTLAALAQALAELSPAYRDVIELRYFDGLSTAEIAARTGGSELAVRKRLWRARLRLRDALDREVGGGARILAALAPWSAWSRSPGRLLAVGSGLAAGVVLSVGALTLWTARAGSTSGAPVAERAGARVAAAYVATSGSGVDAGPLPVVHPPIAPLRRPVPPPAEPQEPPAEKEARTARTAAFHHGTVVDLDGQPRSGVTLVERASPDARDARVLAWSGALGTFRIEAANEDAAIVVEARAPALATVVPATFAERADEPQVVVVAPAFDLAGSVVDEDGRTLAGASLEVRCRDTAFARIGLPVRLDSAVLRALTADAQGAFSVPALPRGADLFVEVRSAGHEPLLVETPALGSEARFVLRRSAQPILVAGMVTRRDGRPAAGATVQLGRERTTTDADGRWELAVGDVDPEAPLAATDEKAAPALVHGFGARVRAGLDGEVELRLGDEHDPVTGKLVGAHTGGWVVAAFPDDEGADVAEPRALTRSDADGAFELWLPRGAYTLHALAPEALCVATRAGLDTRSGVWHVPVPASAERVTIAGRARADDGRPLARAALDVHVRLDGHGGSRSLAWAAIAADAGGAFAFPAQPGLALEVVPRHPAAAVQAFALTASALPEPLALVVPRRAYVQVAAVDVARCTVLDADGRTLAVRGPLGETQGFAFRAGRSPMVEVPAAARWLALAQPGAAPELVPLEAVPGQHLLVRP